MAAQRAQLTFEFTLALFKPDLVCRVESAKIARQMIINEGLQIVQSKRMRLSQSEAMVFYQEHKNGFYYQRLVEYMTSDYCHALILSGPDSIKKWRSLMGPTKPSKAKQVAPNSIRAKFGLTDTQNSVHGSDSVENALKEINYIFPEYKWCSVHGLESKMHLKINLNKE